VVSVLEQLLLPAECRLCRSLLPFPLADSLVCPLCRLRWRRVVPPWCGRCSQPEPHFGPCRVCADWPRALRSARSAVWLEGGARDAIHALKYGGLPKIARDLADAMARALPRPDASSVLVSVPLGPRRQRERGYNQSERLADALSHRWELPAAALLTRVRDTATQTALTPKARLANVAGAFGLRIGDCGLRIGGAPAKSAIRNPQSAIVLVDDVFTTGATLAECARALAGAGATDISAVTFGRAAIPDFT
jgi:ComF family protein